MKRVVQFLVLISAFALYSNYALAGSWKLHYKLKPGQVWIATLHSQSETAFMGKKNITRTKTLIEYKVCPGPKKGWVSLKARIKSQSGPSGQSGGQMDLSRLRFTADMHRSGEIRNIQYSGNPFPGMQANTKGMPAGMAAMYEQSSRMVAEPWKNAVFWFPELPEDSLEIGDEFDVTRKMGAGGRTGGMQMQSVSKQLFTLEDVSEGLAYFTIRERTITRTGSPMGGKSDTKTAGKAKAVFDLHEGMWAELAMKSRSRVQLGNMPGMSGGGTHDVLQVSKYTVERKK